MEMSWEARALTDKAQWKYVMPEVNDGAIVCKMLKEIFFEKETWCDCNMAVVKKFTELKEVMRKIYPLNSTADIVKELASYNCQDIEDIFG